MFGSRLLLNKRKPAPERKLQRLRSFNFRIFPSPRQTLSGQGEQRAAGHALSHPLRDSSSPGEQAGQRIAHFGNVLKRMIGD